MERYDEALADLTHAIDLARAIELVDASAWIIGTRAEVRQAMGMLEAALADYTWAIELDPDRGWPVAMRADVYQALGKHQEAIANTGAVPASGGHSRSNSGTICPVTFIVGLASHPSRIWAASWGAELSPAYRTSTSLVSSGCRHSAVAAAGSPAGPY